MTNEASRHLLDAVQKVETFLDLSARVRQGLPGSLRLKGLAGGSAAVLAGHLFETAIAPKGPLMWILPDAESAEAARDDLEFLLGEGNVVHFPEPESLPYDRKSPAPQGVSARLAALDRLLEGAPVAVVTSFRAIAGRVLPPNRLREGTLRLKVGEKHSPTKLRARLLNLGYATQPVVSVHGEMSARGGILDVFASGLEEPLRIEWDGDEIVSLRTFDPQTQRSSATLQEARILPRRELVPDPERVEEVARLLEQRGRLFEAAARERREKSGALLEQLEHSAQPTDSPESDGETGRRLSDAAHRDPDFHFVHHPPENIEELRHHVLEERIFEGMERLLSFYEPGLVSVFDYLPASTVVLVTDWSRQRARAEAFADEVTLIHKEAQREWPLISPPEELFLTAQGMEDALLAHKALFDESVNTGLPFSGELIFRTQASEPFSRNLELLRERLRKWLEEGFDVTIFCDNTGQRDRLEELLEGIRVRLDIGSWSAGFELPAAGLIVLTDHEIFSRYRRRQRRGKFKGGLTYADFLALGKGDYVVHVDHGVGVYRGLERITLDGQETDCLKVEYAQGDSLFVPVSQMGMVQKYAAQESSAPKIHRLGSNAWQKTRQRIKKAMQDMAEQLLKTYAARAALPGHAFGPDEDLQRQLEASFIYDETPDQLRAVEEVKADMERPRPMDRLVCGDVGYGKTEVAVRAALKAVVGGRQVAVLVPTTILAQQHYNTFSDRLAGFPVRVGLLSRFRSPQQLKDTVKKLAQGELDIVVGTHRLLSKDVQFADLGLVVVDEEHRFGVAHKEKLRTLRTLVDVLTLTATPIPRTLNLGLVGARDMSRIETPPRDRLPVHTEIVEFDPELVKDALLREADRGGQAFFVHNRVETIDAMATFLRRLCPMLKFAVAHGQMNEHALERVMLDFMERRYDVLVSTMIIESGIDIPTTNTLLVHHAENFGLAQLYQLRGRVGRSHHRAYCYLIVPARRVLTEVAEKRLKVIEEYQELGAGLKIAMRDLEIRGAGNLLGAEQTGFIESVGFEMYLRMLEEVVSEIKGEPDERRAEPRLITDLPAFLPDSYCPHGEKISQYKRLADARRVEQVDSLAEEWRDRFGEPPVEAATLLALRRLRLQAADADIAQLVVEKDRFEVELVRPRPAGTMRKLFEVKEYPLEFSAADPTKMVLRVTKKPGLEAARRLVPLLVESREKA